MLRPALLWNIVKNGVMFEDAINASIRIQIPNISLCGLHRFSNFWVLSQLCAVQLVVLMLMSVKMCQVLLGLWNRPHMMICKHATSRYILM